MSKVKKIAFLVFLTWLLAQPLASLAVGVGVRPSFLKATVIVNQAKSYKLRVYNISQEAALFKVYPDELGDWISVKPQDFRLEAKESKEVEIIIKARQDGRQATNLSVVATPLDKRLFNADSGVKVPLSLEVKVGRRVVNTYVLITVWLVFTFLAICSVIILVLKLRKRSLKERVIITLKKFFRR